MSQHEPPPPDLAAMLQAERDIPPPSATAYARVQARLHASIAGAGISGPPAGTAARVAATKPMVLTVFAVLGVGAVVAYLALRTDTPARAPVDPPAASPRTPLPATSPGPALAPSSPPPALPEQPVISPDPPPLTHDRPAPHRTPDERELLDEAQRCLARRATTCVLAALAAHARHYPKGELAEERDALRVQALDLAGDTTAAQERARRFLDAYSSSVYAPVIRRILEPR